MANQTLLNRQNALLDSNIASLHQALAIVEAIDDVTFTTSPSALAPHRVGSHLRHILEFYQCFLDGLSALHIDYDARKRNESLQNDRIVAADTIRSIINQLERTPILLTDCILWVRMEDAIDLHNRDCFMTSSIGRELQVLSSHTIHHFALIAMTLRAHGVSVAPDFGMAPSTLRYAASKAAA